MLNLNDVYLFSQVIDRKGFAAASRSLRIPKSTLSKRVAALEKSLGTRLILRSARSFTVSAVGREFHEHARAMLREAEAAERAVSKRMAEPSGTVRVTMSMTTAQVTSAGILTALSANYPKIRVELHATNRYVNLIDEGFDVAVRAHYDDLSDSQLIQRRLGRSPMYLVASPSYLNAHRIPRRPEELADHDGLLAQSTHDNWELLSSTGAIFRAVPRPRHFLDEPLTMLHAAIAGLGIACLPKALCSTALKSGTLVQVLPDWSAMGATITMLTPHRRLQSPAAAATLETVAAQVSTAMELDSTASGKRKAPRLRR